MKFVHRYVCTRNINGQLTIYVTVIFVIIFRKRLLPVFTIVYMQLCFVITDLIMLLMRL